LLVEEAAYFVGESVIDEIRHLLGGEDVPQNGTRNPGFDFG
jgi:hypothetical protein